jgi:alkylation response protein AidB-like acyl-CoA dehydrogenase
VDFELNDDQQALRAAARELLDGRSTSAQVRATFETESPWDNELWKAMVDQGWTGIAVAEDAGGVGLGWVEVAVLLEEVGAHVARVT